ncbi:MAG: CRISPR-associated endonuclease Cas1 [Prevotella sp.]|nr:CRISPR-associated endonuclease Cas1 [Prevotella sp.]
MPTQFNTLCQIPRLHLAWGLVKMKGSAGGIDGVTIQEFDKVKRTEIQRLSEELKAGKWKPQPYLEIEIAKTKSPDEVRKLGMTAVRDKIVQHAIKSIIEPRYEKIFLGNSYGYRPGKGATKAIRRVLAESHKSQYKYVLRLDIDNFFDTIDHEILQKRLIATGTEPELVRLIMLCVQMGKVKRGSLEWVETDYGTPQGAVLSPILSNLYLHSFDQFAVSQGVPYIRYADDFLFLTETREQAETILAKTEKHLLEKLKLQLNQPTSIIELKDGFDFLGVTLINKQVSITEKKRSDLCERIGNLEFNIDGFDSKSAKTWDGIANYYAKLLPQPDLEYFDSHLVKRLITIIHERFDMFGSKSNLQFALSTFNFLSLHYQLKKKQFVAEIVAEFVSQRLKDKQETDARKNRKLIQQRKQEYRKLESATSGLLVNKPGMFIGLTNRGVTVSQKGKVISQHHPDNLSQIVITGQGVSMSSNLVGFCMSRKIPIDFFDAQGTHLGSVISAKYMQSTLWAKQAEAIPLRKNTIALGIIEGKIKNQHALLKYFNKYHKSHYPQLQSKMAMMDEVVIKFKSWRKQAVVTNDNFMQELVGHEAQVAIRYWEYIRELFSDDKVRFEQREHRGATDLVNSMLNYGYAILYVRVWQALLAARLNPFESLIHAQHEGKPTLVYDMVEIFRSQVVDRMVISLIQKGQDLEVRDGLLTDKTRQLLVKSVMERLSRYEKYQGEEMKMENIILRQAKLLAKAFEGTEKFKPYVAKW